MVDPVFLKAGPTNVSNPIELIEYCFSAAVEQLAIKRIAGVHLANMSRFSLNRCDESHLAIRRRFVENLFKPASKK